MASSRTALVLIDFQEWIVRDLVAVGGRNAAVAAGLATKQAHDRGELVVHVRYLRLDGSDGGPGATEKRFLDSIGSALKRLADAGVKILGPEPGPA
jgi:nicotinamidase-related amidase